MLKLCTIANVYDSQVAIKSVQLSHSQNISGIERAWREVFILTSLDHEHVIRLHDVSFKQSIPTKFHDNASPTGD